MHSPSSALQSQCSLFKLQKAEAYTQFIEARSVTERYEPYFQLLFDSYRLLAVRTPLRCGIAIAMPPLGVMAISESLNKSLAGQPYECSEPTIAVVQGTR